VEGLVESHALLEIVERLVVLIGLLLKARLNHCDGIIFRRPRFALVRLDYL